MAFEIKKLERQEGNQEFKKMYGIGEFRVLAINPTRQELNKIYQREGKPDDKEIDYLGTTPSGNKYARVNFILETIGADNGIRSVNFFLEDRDVSNKDNTKFEFINQRGMTSWAPNKESLPGWFTKDINVLRQAKVGEGILYRFLRAWLSQHNWYQNEDLFDIKQILKGNVKEISSLVGSEYTGTVLAGVVVKSKNIEKDSEVVTVFNEDVYNGDFLPGKLYNQYKLMNISFPIGDIDKSEKYAVKAVKYFLKNFDPHNEYPIKGVSSILPLQEFVEKDHLVSSNNTMMPDSSY